MANNPQSPNYSSIITLVFEDGQESVKNLNNSIDNLNTKLSAITGFDVVLIKFIGDLPDQTFQVNCSLSNDCLPCYGCTLLKGLSLILVIVSALISLLAFLPKEDNSEIISPSEQAQKFSELSLSEDEYKLFFIDKYSRDIKSLVKVRDQKTKQLFRSAIILLFVATFSSLDVLLATLIS